LTLSSSLFLGVSTDNNYSQSIPQQGTHDQQQTQAPQFTDMEDKIPF